MPEEVNVHEGKISEGDFSKWKKIIREEMYTHGCKEDDRAEMRDTLTSVFTSLPIISQLPFFSLRFESNVPPSSSLINLPSDIRYAASFPSIGYHSLTETYTYRSYI